MEWEMKRIYGKIGWEMLTEDRLEWEMVPDGKKDEIWQQIWYNIMRDDDVGQMGMRDDDVRIEYYEILTDDRIEWEMDVGW
jgi:hypothetical protein